VEISTTSFPGRRAFDPPRSLDPAQSGHADADGDHIRLQRLDHLDGGLAGRRFGYRLELAGRAYASPSNSRRGMSGS
jgi:hypothetical protein